jgi:hypothetical protein
MSTVVACKVAVSRTVPVQCFLQLFYLSPSWMARNKYSTFMFHFVTGKLEILCLFWKNRERVRIQQNS